MTGWFHKASCPQKSFMLQHGQNFLPFQYWIIFHCGMDHFWLVHPLMGTSVASTFWWFWGILTVLDSASTLSYLSFQVKGRLDRTQVNPPNFCFTLSLNRQGFPTFVTAPAILSAYLYHLLSVSLVILHWLLPDKHQGKYSTQTCIVSLRCYQPLYWGG